MLSIYRLLQVLIPLDSGLIFLFAGSVLVCGREQLLLEPELRGEYARAEPKSACLPNFA
jgi:hypothetical protein